MMDNCINIQDHAIWFKHLPRHDLKETLGQLPPEGEIQLEIGGVTGRWRRMKRGKDGRLPDAVIPIGPMKTVWNEWFRTRRGDRVTLRILSPADDWLAGMAVLFSEWNSAEDEEAFRDL